MPFILHGSGDDFLDFLSDILAAEVMFVTKTAETNGRNVDNRSSQSGAPIPGCQAAPAKKKVENTKKKKLKIKKKKVENEKKKVEKCPKKGVRSKENWIFTTFLQQNTTFLQKLD